MIAGGATFIQLREKHSPPKAFYDDAADAVRIAHASGAVVIINDRVDIALALEADGVHLGQSDMPVRAARRLLGKDAIIGFSTHNIEQVKEALSLPINYLAFGPVFHTHSKRNPDPIAGTNEFPRIKSLTRSMPVVAIGGIDQTNVVKVLAAGADSAAIVSALLVQQGRIAENLKVFCALALEKQR
jgi:thiamine-phosphate pyrophosphorylase